MDRRHFLAAAGSTGLLGLNACGGGGGSSAPAPAPAPAAAPDWTALQGSIQGTVMLPTTTGFIPAVQVFNAAYGAIPQALVRCASASDVAQSLSFAKANKLALTARSGGHSYIGNSTSTGLVIDVGDMDTITVGSGTATIGAGAKLVDVYDQLSSQGVCIPSGSCPTIGIAGITQGGGIGVVDRAYGLTCDNLVSAQVVLADGSIVICDANTHADLFWALRGGGGGNFGIVTSLTFNTFVTSDLTNFSADFAWTDAAAVIAAWQAWPQVLPDTVWSGLVMATSATGSPSLEVSGTFIGSSADFAPIWTAFLAATGATPTAQSVQTQSFRDTMLSGCGSLTVSECHLPSETSDGEVTRAAFVATSDFFNAPLPSAGIQALIAAVNAQQGIAGIVVIMDLMGGAINRVATDATAFVHRNAVFSAQYYLEGPVGTDATLVAEARSIATGMRTAMSTWSSGECYQNYLDPNLANWQAAYYGANYARLVTVKAAYDPTGVFAQTQGIPTS